MVAPAKLHPTDQTLSSYGLGKLDVASAEAVNRHVESCPGCRNRFAALSSDSFLGRPHAAQAKGRSDSPAPLNASTAGLSMLASGGPSVPVPPSASSLPPSLADRPDSRNHGQRWSEIGVRLDEQINAAHHRPCGAQKDTDHDERSLPLRKRLIPQPRVT